MCDGGRARESECATEEERESECAKRRGGGVGGKSSEWHFSWLFHITIPLPLDIVNTRERSL